MKQRLLLLLSVLSCVASCASEIAEADSEELVDVAEPVEAALQAADLPASFTAVIKKVGSNPSMCGP